MRRVIKACAFIGELCGFISVYVFFCSSVFAQHPCDANISVAYRLVDGLSVAELVSDNPKVKIIQPQFDEAEGFHAGVAPIKVREKWGFIDKTGKIVIEPQFEKDYPAFEEGLRPLKAGEKYGFMDTNGKMLIEPQFDVAGVLAKASRGSGLERARASSTRVEKSCYGSSSLIR